MNERYKGKRVMLTEMVDEPHMTSGIFGTIQHEDDANQIHVKWDNGSVLALIPIADSYQILSDKDIRKMKIDTLDNNI
jgi:hypothetical protein